ncbi:MAG: HEAT repeat domain-containing protein [Phycisphaerales bacterium]|nr:MAG: HEAT repeat domain-containing protein [Phycisphaerales bacterium]
MVILWLAVLLSRNVIRAQWWTYRLAAAKTPTARMIYFYRLAALGDAAVPAVSRLLRSDDPGLRSFAVGVAHHASGEEASALLVRACDDADVDVARLAIQGLGIHGDEADVNVLRSIAAADDRHRAMIAAAALAGVNSVPAKKALIDLVRRSPHTGARVEAIKALGTLRAVEAIGVLVEALNDGAVFEGVIESDTTAVRIFETAKSDLMREFKLPEDASVEVEDHHAIWECAAKALRTITGHSHDFSAEEAANQTFVAKAWRNWWQTAKAEDGTSPP